MESLLQTLNNYVGTISGIVWGPYCLIPILLLVGIFLTLRLKFISFREMGYAFKVMWRGRKAHPAHEGELTPFRAMMASLAATVGTGNIVGVATAITMGGPGALFWMWVTALIGMTTKFCEATLAVHYREVTPEGRFVGGPMYYIKNGLGKNWKWLAALFAIFGTIASFGIGNMTQANAITHNIAGVLSADAGTQQTISYVVAVVLFLTVGAVVIGGVKRVGAVAGTLVPAMAILYVVAGLILLIMNIGAVPAAFMAVFKSAFGLEQVAGGAVGSAIMLAMRFGIARGLFSNEAGLGSAPIAHATAIVKHPVKQGLLGMIDPFIDTIIVCSISGLVILVSGIVVADPTAPTGYVVNVGAGVLTQTAFDSILPGMKWIVTISLILFAFTTILGWCVYGERCVIYLFGDKASLPFRVFFTIIVPLGSLMELSLVWGLSDLFNGLMALPNLFALALLSPVVIKLVKDYFGNPENLKDE
jgi:AGCS family alanine or glycine:cation symporter